MTIEAERANVKKYSEQLHSLYEVFLGIKMLYSCTVPSNKYRIVDRYFEYLNAETRKLVFGKLYIILSDAKSPTYNTTSFKILVQSIIDDDDKVFGNKRSLKTLLEEIEDLPKKYKDLRDKNYAHIELDEDDSLKKIGTEITNRDITYLLNLNQKAYDQLFLLLCNSSSDHMSAPIEELSKKLWESYEKVGLVKKV